jgi:predicted phosphoadenosine phosphosulfate sulfurtransferase
MFLVTHTKAFFRADIPVSAVKSMGLMGPRLPSLKNLYRASEHETWNLCLRRRDGQLATARYMLPS